jgi:hypothetical protein
VSTMSAGKHRDSDPTDPVVEQEGALAPDVVETPAPAGDADPTQPTQSTPSLPTVVTETSSARREVTCPECGTVATIAVNRREAEDFCRRCDFPLFWTPAAIVMDTSGGPASDALRRLPGTAGRVTVGRLACPHCAEMNPVTETHCLRCRGDLHPPIPPAPQAPVALAPPPEPTPEPEKKTPWWVWAGLALTLAVLVALIVYLVR